MTIGFTRKTLAKRWDSSVRYIEGLDARREGPPRIKIAGKWVYPPEGVEDYENSLIEVQCNSPLKSAE